MRKRVSLFIALTFSAAAAIGGRYAKAAPKPPAAKPAVSRPASATVKVAAPAPVSAAATDLRNEIERTIQSPGWRGDEWSVTVVSLTRGDTLVAHNPDLELAPASGLKLFTTSAALYYLGPDYRYSTFLLGDGPVQNGVLNGNLIVYGTGDPTFTARFGHADAAFQEFADSLAAQGVTQINGDVIGDASYFPGRGTGVGWESSYIGASYAVASSALSYTENLVNLRVTGTTDGAPVSVTSVPGGDGIAVDNRAITGRGRSVLAQRDEYEGPLVVRGGMRPGTSLQRVVPVGDPAQYAAAVMREVLRNHGIQVSGNARAVHTPSESPVTGRSVFAPAFDKAQPLHVFAVHQSQPLIKVLTIINKESHNMFAEQTFRTVGRVAYGDGSIDGGYKAVKYMIECESPGDSVALHMYDGSGLSPLNRVSSRTMVRLLSAVHNSPIYESLTSTMNTAGVDRHLRRMYGTAAARNLKAKTGTIDNVSSLSGYVRASNGELLAFSIISNNVPSTWKAKRIEDAIGARLASFYRPVEDIGNTAPLAAATPNAEPPIPQSGPAAAPSQPAPTAAAATTPQPAPAPAPAPASPPPPATPAAQLAADVESATTKMPATGKSSKSATSARASSGSGSYKIKRGDTLGGIAKRNGVSLKALQRANPGLSARRLTPGKTIRIP